MSPELDRLRAEHSAAVRKYRSAPHGMKTGCERGLRDAMSRLLAAELRAERQADDDVKAVA